MELLVSAMIVGSGATAVTDLWFILRRLAFGIAPPDFGLVGRWLAYMPRGRFCHDSIAAAPRVRGERLVGWVAHYLIGMSFAGLLLGIWGIEWMHGPTLGPALIVGVGTVAAPFFIMQPGMGAGIAAGHTPRPRAARIQSLVTHAIFGGGLYVAALLADLPVA